MLRAAVLVLALAAFNLFFRLGSEAVGDWDEALYGVSAAEAVTSGSWVATTYLGEIDYYNSKPPLNVWAIATTFLLLEPGPVTLRLVSALSALATVAVLVFWAAPRHGAATALLAGVVLSTTFGFLHVHSGRSGNADAPFTLIVLLTVVAAAAGRMRPSRLVWLGPLLAAAFLLKGPAFALPITIAALVVVAPPAVPLQAMGPLLVAVGIFVTVVGGWAVARSSVDGSRLFEVMWQNDVLGISTEVQEGHGGSPFFYLDVLQKHHYDWLAAAALSWALVPPRARWWRRPGVVRRDDMAVYGAWTLVCLAIPSLMQTKLAWYLNPLYPAFALGVAASLVRGLSHPRVLQSRWRWSVVIASIVVAFGVAEAKLLWYSYDLRDISRTAQPVLIEARERLQGARVFRDAWDPGDLFVLRAMAGATHAYAGSPEEFLHHARAGDYFLAEDSVAHAGLHRVTGKGRYALYTRTD